MAIKWEKIITVLDAKKGNVSITLTRIDDTDPANVKTLNTCSVSDALINTPELRQQVLLELKRQYQSQKQKVIDDAAIAGAFDAEIVADVKMWGV